MDPQWLTALTALLVAAAGCALFVARRLWHMITRVLRFLDDWNGEPAQGGRPATPGVMARLQAVEDTMANVLAETRPNGGKSLRDDVSRIGAGLTEHRAAVREDAARAHEAVTAAATAAEAAASAARSLDDRMTQMETKLAEQLATTCMNFKPASGRETGKDQA